MLRQLTIQSVNPRIAPNGSPSCSSHLMLFLPRNLYLPVSGLVEHWRSTVQTYPSPPPRQERPSSPPSSLGSHASLFRKCLSKLQVCLFIYISHHSFRLEPAWSPDGLSEEAAAEILSSHGLNVPVNERPLAALSILWTALWNPFNVLLTVLALVNIATNSVPTFVVMMAMVVASTSLRYFSSILAYGFAQACPPRIGTGKRSSPWSKHSS